MLNSTPEITQPVVLSWVPDISRLELLDEAGQVMQLENEQGPYPASFDTPPTKQNGPTFEDMAGWFTRMYVAIGPGTHTLPEVVEATKDLYMWRIQGAAECLARLLPATLFEYGPNDSGGRNGWLSFRNQNMSIASRYASPEELTAFREEQERQERETKAFRHAQAERKRQKDAEKTDLNLYDHACIAIASREYGQQLYVLEFDGPETLLAARLLEALSHRFRDARAADVSLKILTLEMFRLMPEAERKTLGVSMSKKMYAATRQLLKGLTDPVGVASWRAPDMVVPGRARVALEYVQTKPDKPYGGNVIFMHPPGFITPEERDLAAVREPDAREVYELAVSHREVDPTQAVRILDFIKDPACKIALKTLLEEMPRAPSYGDIEFRVHQAVSRALGAGYAGANTARTSFGNTVRGIEQIGGELPAARTKWHLGRRPIIHGPKKEDGPDYSTFRHIEQ